MGLERRIPVTESKNVNIPFEEYKNLLLTSLRVDLLCDAIEAGEYVSVKDIRLIFGIKQKENENV